MNIVFLTQWSKWIYNALQVQNNGMDWCCTLFLQMEPGYVTTNKHLCCISALVNIVYFALKLELVFHFLYLSHAALSRQWPLASLNMSTPTFTNSGPRLYSAMQCVSIVLAGVLFNSFSSGSRVQSHWWHIYCAFAAFKILTVCT